jgi:hypothetical protein
MSSLKRIFTLTAIVILPCAVFSQTNSSFDLNTYRQFLSSHQNMTPEQLQAFRPAGTFAKTAPTNFGGALYADTIQMKYKLTAGERSLIEANGFMVTERLKRRSFGDAFAEIYNSDLPVFVSTDAVLHAIHMSYDAMLKDTEERVLIAKLDSLLARLHGQLTALSAKYASTPAMKRPLCDVDLYLTVARKLLKPEVTPTFTESAGAVDTIMGLIKTEQAADYQLFSSTPRHIDFSQFTVRGHYTQSPELGKYFQSMIWLGRTEMYLMAPVNSNPPPLKADIQRQTIDAALVAEASKGADADASLEEIDSILRMFVGESDNVTLPNVNTVLQAAGIAGADMLLDTLRLQAFQDTLAQKSFAFQRILSQIIISDPGSPDNIRPASSFLLLGQRFVIDSYVTGSVVYDKIKFENKKIWRPLPSSLDVLFSLGNDASAQLLTPELAKYHYASNLASLRYLVDSYDKDFWTSTLYNGWLNSIRALNPSADRSAMPRFMQTAAWWQEKMTTQLASWAQLRHDNLLYAKQSYTGGTTCSFPESYVEPIPEFFAAVKKFATDAEQKFTAGPLGRSTWISGYWAGMKAYADTLGSIAQKERSMTPLSEVEKQFLRSMLFTWPLCGMHYSGWYYRMYYNPEGDFTKENLVVADVHTCPTDESGNMVGWVMHAGTGPVNLAVVTTELPDGRLCSFVGPVLSYYEYVSANFKRLTDEEWTASYQTLPAFRPDFVNLYLADSLGGSRGTGPSLLTGVIDNHGDGTLPSTIQLGPNYPNPFNGTTIITFSIPRLLTDPNVDLTIYDIQGRRVKQLVHQPMAGGTYSVRWDGTNERGLTASSGVYFYHLSAGGQKKAGKMSFVK